MAMSKYEHGEMKISAHLKIKKNLLRNLVRSHLKAHKIPEMFESRCCDFNHLVTLILTS